MFGCVNELSQVFLRKKATILGTNIRLDYISKITDWGRSSNCIRSPFNRNLLLFLLLKSWRWVGSCSKCEDYSQPLSKIHNSRQDPRSIVENQSFWSRTTDHKWSIYDFWWVNISIGAASAVSIWFVMGNMTSGCGTKMSVPQWQPATNGERMCRTVLELGWNGSGSGKVSCVSLLFVSESRPGCRISLESNWHQGFDLACAHFWKVSSPDTRPIIRQL